MNNSNSLMSKNCQLNCLQRCSVELINVRVVPAELEKYAKQSHTSVIRRHISTPTPQSASNDIIILDNACRDTSLLHFFFRNYLYECLSLSENDQARRMNNAVSVGRAL